jgi:hypothetical protein
MTGIEPARQQFWRLLGFLSLTPKMDPACGDWAPQPSVSSEAPLLTYLWTFGETDWILVPPSGNDPLPLALQASAQTI